jgi:hypothetical protein
LHYVKMNLMNSLPKSRRKNEMNEEIICECGHKAYEHNRFAGYNCHWKKFNVNCECHLSKETVEARYWARRMKKERDEQALRYVQLWNENASLQADMDDARDKNLSLWNTTQVQQDIINRLRKQLEEAHVVLRYARNSIDNYFNLIEIRKLGKDNK